MYLSTTSSVSAAAYEPTPLYDIQRPAGHADPRTTERYVRQSGDLKNNAARYVHL